MFVLPAMKLVTLDVNHAFFIVECTLSYTCIPLECYFSPVPLLSRLLPSDVCRIYKTGSCIRYMKALIIISTCNDVSASLPPLYHLIILSYTSSISLPFLHPNALSFSPTPPSLPSFLPPRLDSTLGDFSGMQWTRGNVSFIFNGEETRSDSLSMVVLDNDSKEYQRMKLIGSVCTVHVICTLYIYMQVYTYA